MRGISAVLSAFRILIALAVSALPVIAGAEPIRLSTDEDAKVCIPEESVSRSESPADDDGALECYPVEDDQSDDDASDDDSETPDTDDDQSDDPYDHTEEGKGTIG